MDMSKAQYKETAASNRRQYTVHKHAIDKNRAVHKHAIDKNRGIKPSANVL